MGIQACVLFAAAVRQLCERYSSEFPLTFFAPLFGSCQNCENPTKYLKIYKLTFLDVRTIDNVEVLLELQQMAVL